MQEAFCQAMTVFPFVPKFYVDPALDWLMLDGVVVQTDSLIRFLGQAL